MSYMLYSKRQEQLRKDPAEPLIYDRIPPAFRRQVIGIWERAIGPLSNVRRNYLREPPTTQVQIVYGQMVEYLREEYGFDRLPSSNLSPYTKASEELDGFFRAEQNVERVLDVVETSFLTIADIGRRRFDLMGRPNADQTALEAIDELNSRFREHNLGYSFNGSLVIRTDSFLLHEEIVAPAISLLGDPAYKGAEQEFLGALRKHRAGESEAKHVLNECLKALESVLKVICAKRQWAHSENATCKALLDTAFTQGLIPQFWLDNFTGFRNLLQSGVPTARNRLGGHGQGTKFVAVPPPLVAFVIHQTAAAILFLVKSEKYSRSEAALDPTAISTLETNGS